MLLSVIIPTRNRAKILSAALESISCQTLSPHEFETIIFDNGSIDNTKGITQRFSEKIQNLHYLYDETPGLHVGRHRGLKEANADILVYADDDIEAFPTWLEAIVEAFKDQNVALVGGKNLPKFETEPPSWLKTMWSIKHSEGNVLGTLSILDLGDMKKEIAPFYVFGCNFAIRRSILLESCGFHPDAFPQELIRYRGDGESCVTDFIQSKGYKALYNPMASIYHWIPNSRMTIEHFYRRAYNQGISDSYTAIRRTKGQLTELRSKSFLEKVGEKTLQEIPHVIWRRMKRSMSAFVTKTARSNLSQGNSQLNVILRELALSHKAGYAFHQREVKEDLELLKWVLRQNYLGESGKLP